MAQVKFEIIVDIKGNYGDDSVLDREESKDGITLKQALKNFIETKLKENSVVIRGDVQSNFVSSQVTDL